MNKQVEAFPWGELTAFGLGVLRLPPEMFWRSTPCEMAAAMSAFGMDASQTMSAKTFAKLMSIYPDADQTKDTLNER